MGRIKKPMDTYQGRSWDLAGRPKTLYDLIEERRAERERKREDREAKPDAKAGS